MFDTATLIAIHDKLQRALAQVGGRIDAFFFCPHAADAGCACRKPQPGMLLEVARRFNVPLEEAYMVGDASATCEAAAAAGAQPVLVLTGHGRKTRAEGGLPPGTRGLPRPGGLRRALAP